MKKLLSILAFFCCINTLAYANLTEGVNATKTQAIEKKSAQVSIPLYLKNQIQATARQAFETNTTIVLDSITMVERATDEISGEREGKSIFSIAPDGLVTTESSSKILGVWTQTIKNESKFDKNGNLILSINYPYYNQKYIPLEKDEYEYENGRITKYFSYRWSTILGIWTGVTADEVSYNDDGIVTSRTTYENWDASDNEWRKKEMKEYEFDEFNRIIHSLEYKNWDTSNKRWGDIRDEKIEYDEAGRITLSESKMWDYDTDQWGETSVSIETFDKDGRPLIQKLLTMRDSYIKEYEYDEAGRTTLKTHLYDQISPDKWMTGEKEEFKYDDLGREIGKASYYWAKIYDDWKWIGTSKYEMKYNKDQEEDSAIYYDWDRDINEWIGFSKQEILRDQYENIISDIVYSSQDETTKEWTTIESGLKYEYTYHPNNSIKTAKKFRWSNSQWEEVGIHTYYYAK